MKNKTISYIVYPANYSPGDGYKRAKQLKDAKKIAMAYGVGAEIWRRVFAQNKLNSLSSLNFFRRVF